MVVTDGIPSIDDLSSWQTAMSRQAEELRADIKAKQADLAQLDERLSLVTKLIEAEARARGSTPTAKGGLSVPLEPTDSDVSWKLPAEADLEDAVEELLRAAGEPLHISRIREELAAQGVSIPGRGDDANIIVRLRRYGDRFTRTARGTYGLAEWGLPALRTKAGKRRKAATR